MTSGSGGCGADTAVSLTACSSGRQPPGLASGQSVDRSSRRDRIVVTGGYFSPECVFDHPDPYPMFAMLRQTQPVMRAEFMNRVAFVLTKYDDCFAVLKDSETYSSRSNAEVGKIMGRTVIEMDAKEHTRHRALVQQVFVPKGLDGLAPVLRSEGHRSELQSLRHSVCR